MRKMTIWRYRLLLASGGYMDDPENGGGYADSVKFAIFNGYPYYP